MDFDFKQFEKEAQEKWKIANAFKFDNNSKNPYYVLESCKCTCWKRSEKSYRCKLQSRKDGEFCGVNR